LPNSARADPILRHFRLRSNDGLEGMPLHWQLTYCNARHLATTTAPTYRLDAMADSMPG